MLIKLNLTSHVYFVLYCVCVCSGSPKTLTVDGADAQTVLPNLIPGVTYQVTVIAVKGQKESQPTSDSVTTGETASPTPTHTHPIILSCIS